MRDLEVRGSNPLPGISKAVDWEGFKAWLLQSKSERVARDIVNYAKRFKRFLFSGDLSEIASFSQGKRKMTMQSLSNLAKYLGVYDRWVSMVKRYGLKWMETGVRDQRIIDRLTKTVDSEDVFKWIRQVKEKRPDLNSFMDLMAVTGMRLVEAVNCYNLIIKLSREGKLNEYYDSDKEILQHYKFKELFLRKGKKTFISFVPKEIVEEISIEAPLKSHWSIEKRVKKAGLPVRFSDIREVHGSVLTRYLREAEINFIHGRVGTSVFMENYFNPAWISDLKERMFKAIEEIQNKISTA